MKAKLFIAGAMLSAAMSAHAEPVTNTITFTEFQSDNGSMVAVIDGVGDFTQPVMGDGLFSVVVWNWEVAPASFYFDFSLDGVNLGRLFDSNPNNDPFNAGVNQDDVGLNYRENRIEATIDMAFLSSLLSDGSIQLRVTPSAPVERYWLRDGEITYAVSSPEDVALSGSAVALLSIGAGAFSLRRSRKKATV